MWNEAQMSVVGHKQTSRAAINALVFTNAIKRLTRTKSVRSSGKATLSH